MKRLNISETIRYTASLILLSCTLILSANSADTEKKIISLSEDWNQHIIELTSNIKLNAFCNNDARVQNIFVLLDEIHYYHDVLEEELRTTTYNHSRRYITRILKHMDKLDEKYHTEEFANFFGEHCAQQYKIHRTSEESGSGIHSFHGKVYAQDVSAYRYIIRLTKHIGKIKKNVEQFYIRRIVWES